MKSYRKLIGSFQKSAKEFLHKVESMIDNTDPDQWKDITDKSDNILSELETLITKVNSEADPETVQQMVQDLSTTVSRSRRIAENLDGIVEGIRRHGGFFVKFFFFLSTLAILSLFV